MSGVNDKLFSIVTPRMLLFVHPTTIYLNSPEVVGDVQVIRPTVGTLIELEIISGTGIAVLRAPASKYRALAVFATFLALGGPS